ncbi:hypothetical protein WR25_23098 [Diploscapter pachys]|uniref:Solute-binding protein family 3/N-terminal domain-containing protein n=1 Tax=Diploscapter pachys TaxID=2018661 RepID=A0A2A2KEX7_9BILA|nr:hypothetical protein WR25_23098 [Diploscapter pachys]
MSGRCLGLSVWLSCLLAVIPLHGLATDSCKHLTATGNPEYPPYLWRDPHNPEQLIGANADLLKEVAKDLGLVVDVVYVGPWSRAQEEVSSGRIDMLAGYFRTQARELLTDFISPPFLFNSSVVWVRKGEGFAYSDWSDLKGRRGGTLVNNSHGQAFDDYARAQLHLEAVPSATQAFQKLLFRRSDYVIFEQYPGMALARTLGKEKELERLPARHGQCRTECQAAFAAAGQRLGIAVGALGGVAGAGVLVRTTGRDEQGDGEQGEAHCMPGQGGHCRLRERRGGVLSLAGVASLGLVFLVVRDARSMGLPAVDAMSRSKRQVALCLQLLAQRL